MLWYKSCMHVFHCMITLVKTHIVVQLDSQTLGDILQQASWGDSYTKYYLHCCIHVDHRLCLGSGVKGFGGLYVSTIVIGLPIYHI